MKNTIVPVDFSDARTASDFDAEKELSNYSLLKKIA